MVRLDFQDLDLLVLVLVLLVGVDINFVYNPRYPFNQTKTRTQDLRG